MDNSQILELQMRQYCHDEIYHTDIMHLGTQGRIKHLVLHFAKYIAKLNCPQGFDSSKIIGDIFICCLSLANLLDVTIIINDDNISQNSNCEGLLIILAYMAKAAEALDHVESYPSRTVIEEQVNILATYILQIGKRKNLDIYALINKRWHEIESKKKILPKKPI